jgi:hypothetical protein
MSPPAVFKVLGAVHELLRSGRQATQRDLYYKVYTTASHLPAMMIPRRCKHVEMSAVCGSFDAQ